MDTIETTAPAHILYHYSIQLTGIHSGHGKQYTHTYFTRSSNEENAIDIVRSNNIDFDKRYPVIVKSITRYNVKKSVLSNKTVTYENPNEIILRGPQDNARTAHKVWKLSTGISFAIIVLSAVIGLFEMLRVFAFHQGDYTSLTPIVLTIAGISTIGFFCSQAMMEITKLEIERFKSWYR